MILPRSKKTSSLYLPIPSLQNGGSCGISCFGPSTLSKLRYRRPGIGYGIRPTLRLILPLIRRRPLLLPMRIGSRIFRKSHTKLRFQCRHHKTILTKIIIPLLLHRQLRRRKLLSNHLLLQLKLGAPHMAVLLGSRKGRAYSSYFALFPESTQNGRESAGQGV